MNTMMIITERVPFVLNDIVDNLFHYHILILPLCTGS
jgi:hypothetical protein